MTEGNVQVNYFRLLILIVRTLPTASASSVMAVVRFVLNGIALSSHTQVSKCRLLVMTDRSFLFVETSLVPFSANQKCQHPKSLGMLCWNGNPKICLPMNGLRNFKPHQKVQNV
jgi:hypothetical protein